MKTYKFKWFALLMILAMMTPALPTSTTYAQGTSQTFPETGKTVKGKFLQYWRQHGGLAQQGFPISEEMQEKSDINGQVYTVQYFERAVFEYHPESAPNDVLLSLLGVVFYQQRYGNTGAPGQVPNTSPGSVVYPQTGHRLGGLFMTYWQNHGGLAQQGYPISDEFQEVSATDGKTYTVQYFERAVFENHGGQVLLSLLGVFQYKAKYSGQQPAPVNTGHQNKDATVQPTCGTPGTTFRLTAVGFTPGEPLSAWYTDETSGQVVGTANPSFETPSSGTFYWDTQTDLNWGQGWYAMTWEGAYSHHQSIGWFQVVANNSQCGAAPPPTQPTPQPNGGGHQNKDASMQPTCGTPGTTFRMTATGFTPNEPLSAWYTEESTGQVVGTANPSFQAPGSGSFYWDTQTDTSWAQGWYAMTWQGAYSNHQSVGWFHIVANNSQCGASSSTVETSILQHAGFVLR